MYSLRIETEWRIGSTNGFSRIRRQANILTKTDMLLNLV